MKRMKWVWTCSTVLLLALTTTASWAQEGMPGELPEPGIAVVGFSQETAPALDAAYVGTAELNVNGESYQVESSSTPLVLTGQVDFLGRLVATSSHVYRLADGSTLTTVDELRLLPTQPGWFMVRGTMEITGATGIFANGQGTIDVWGQIQIGETEITAISLLDGRILF
jgi:hypothetical protein